MRNEVERGKVNSFSYDMNKVQCGEISILTNDPNVQILAAGLFQTSFTTDVSALLNGTQLYT